MIKRLKLKWKWKYKIFTLEIWILEYNKYIKILSNIRIENKISDGNRNAKYHIEM